MRADIGGADIGGAAIGGAQIGIAQIGGHVPPTSPAPKPPKLVEEAPRPAEVEVHLGLPAARTCRRIGCSPRIARMMLIAFTCPAAGGLLLGNFVESGVVLGIFVE